MKQQGNPLIACSITTDVQQQRGENIKYWIAKINSKND
jgi:exoribonuclease II